MSLLRAKCPYCKTYTAVAMGPAMSVTPAGASSPPASFGCRARGVTAET